MFGKLFIVATIGFALHANVLAQSRAPKKVARYATIEIAAKGPVRVTTDVEPVRELRLEEVADVLTRIPSLTTTTRITISVDRDVPNGITSIVKQMFEIAGYQVVDVVQTNKGVDAVLVIIEDGLCHTEGFLDKKSPKFNCANLLDELATSHPDKAQTMVLVTSFASREPELAKKLEKDAEVAGYQINRTKLKMGFITEPPEPEIAK
jgi:biopolymer transport protein ExbD